MLEWYDAEQSDKLNKSPLILVPVKVFKKSIRSGYQIEKTDEDPIVNLSLQEKLSSNFNLTLPEISDDEKFNPIEYFDKIKKIISQNSNWKIKEDIFLGFFSFANFVMYKDLEKHNQIYSNHSIIKDSGYDELSDSNVSDHISADELDIKENLMIHIILDAVI